MIIPCARSSLRGSQFRTFWIDFHGLVDSVLPTSFSNVRYHYRPMLLRVNEKLHEPLSTMIRP